MVATMVSRVDENDHFKKPKTRVVELENRTQANGFINGANEPNSATGIQFNPILN